MTIDDRALHDLIVESEDLQVDALRDQTGVNAALAEIHQQHVRDGIDPDELRESSRRYNEQRERTLHEGPGIGTLAAGGAIAALFGGVLTALSAGPAAADTSDVDVMILQTAASIENLAVATYGAALTLPFIKNGNATVVAFAQTTLKQHTQHGSAFNDNATSLGGKAQTKTNAKYQKVVNDALPTLKAPGDVVTLAIALEQVAAQTYNNNISLMRDTTAKSLMASVMGVESQHLAILRAVNALLAGGGADLIKIPTDLAKLPAAAGSVGFSGNFEGTEKASPPAEGAVK